MVCSDYVDRGKQGLECTCLLLAYKVGCSVPLLDLLSLVVLVAAAAHFVKTHTHGNFCKQCLHTPDQVPRELLHATRQP
jgi:hypothetical protein